MTLCQKFIQIWPDKAQLVKPIKKFYYGITDRGRAKKSPPRQIVEPFTLLHFDTYPTLVQWLSEIKSNLD